MIDTDKFTDYDRTDAELEEFFLFCAIVSGKDAKAQAGVLNDFLSVVFGRSPFDKVRRLIRGGMLVEHLKECRVAQHNRIAKLFEEVLDTDLRSCTVDDLEALKGCSPKTARLFLMHTRPNQKMAAIDTHVLKHLARLNIKVPKATPPAGPTYRRLEADFIRLAEAADMEVAEYDIMVWKQFGDN